MGVGVRAAKESLFVLGFEDLRGREGGREKERERERERETSLWAF